MAEGQGHLYDGLHVESLVADLLREAGFVILEQNFRLNHLELDLIAIDGDHICFIEVKARSSEYLLQDVDVLINAKKRNNITLAAESYLRQHPELFHYQVRFDYALAHVDKGKEPHIRYIKNAFVPGLIK